MLMTKGGVSEMTTNIFRRLLSFWTPSWKTTTTKNWGCFQSFHRFGTGFLFLLFQKIINTPQQMRPSAVSYISYRMYEGENSLPRLRMYSQSTRNMLKRLTLVLWGVKVPLCEEAKRAHLSVTDGTQQSTVCIGTDIRYSKDSVFISSSGQFTLCPIYFFPLSYCCYIYQAFAPVMWFQYSGGNDIKFLEKKLKLSDRRGQKGLR